MHIYTYRIARAFCLPRSHCRGWGSQVEGILESRQYRLWLGTVCTLHSKWPPLPYHLWIINVQSVGLSFVIGHSDTVQFSSQPHASLRELGSSLNPLHPPFPLPHHARFYESHRNPGQRVSATILPEERCYRDATVSRPLIIPTLARHRGHGRLLKLTFVWHLSCNIYLLWVVWHLRCYITLLWISMLICWSHLIPSLWEEMI